MKVGDKQHLLTITEINGKKVTARCECGKKVKFYISHAYKYKSCGCYKGKMKEAVKKQKKRITIPPKLRLLEFIESKSINEVFTTGDIREEKLLSNDQIAYFMSDLVESGILIRGDKVKGTRRYFEYWKPDPRVKKAENYFLYGK